MHTFVLCLWVLGIVSAADDKTQIPVYIITKNGSISRLSSGQPFLGTPVSSNNVRVLPNSYTISEALAGGSNSSPISVPVIVNSDTPLQGNTNKPVPVQASYSDDDSAETEQSQPVKPKSIQRAPVRNVTPIPILVKATASAYRSVAPTPRPFKGGDPQLTNNIDSGNPFSVVPPSFRLWPKLPEPVPVPVLTADTFVKSSLRNLNTNLVPQYLQKVPLPVITAASVPNGYQQSQLPVKYPDSSQLQTLQSQSNQGQGPIYIVIPGGNNNAQPATYQAPSPSQNSYQSQASQSGNQPYIITAPFGGTNSQPNNQNNRYSLNPYFGSQPQSQPGQQQPLNDGGFNPFIAASQPQVPFNQPQVPYNQQAPLNYAAFAPQNAAPAFSQPQTQYPDQQSALNYAIFGQQGTPGSLANSAGQTPQNYGVFAPGSAPGSQSNTPGQSPFAYSVFGSSNGQSALPSSTPAPSQFAGYSPTQTPQYFGYSSPTQSPQNLGFPSPTQSPQNFGFPSPTQSPQNFGFPSPAQAPQNFEYSPSTQSPQYFGYSSPTQSPQNFGYSSTQSPQNFEYSPSTQSPQYFGYSSPTQSPQNFGYSSTQSPQNFGYSSSTQSPQNVGYSSSTQSPQYFGSTPAPSQLGYSQSSPLSSVSFSGAGNNYSYSIK